MKKKSQKTKKTSTSLGGHEENADDEEEEEETVPKPINVTLTVTYGSVLSRGMLEVIIIRI